MKKKRMIILILQIVIVLLSVFMIMRYTNRKISPTEVYIYTRNIDDPSLPLGKEDIKKVVVPAEAISKDFARSEDEIIGKHVDAKVFAGQYVYRSQLVEREDVDVFATMDMSKYRKISLPISYVDAFAGNIKRGDTVDLVYTGSGTGAGSFNDDEEEEFSIGGNSGFTYSKVFMQDVLVYSVNSADGYKYIDHSQRLPGYDESKEEISAEATSSGDLAIITFAVTLEQAEQIEARRKTGQISFLGRFDDSKSYNTLGYVLGNYQKVFSGQGFAETDNLMIEEDSFDEIDLNEKRDNEKEDSEKDQDEKNIEEKDSKDNKKDKNNK